MNWTRTRICRVLLASAALLLASGACSDGTNPGASTSTIGRAQATTTPDGTSTTADRPQGPVADMSELLTGGRGVYIGSPERLEPNSGEPIEFNRPGYVEEEYVAAGTAVAYVADGELTSDGRWSFSESESADYRTRVLVRRPESIENTSGVVVVEWLNVSGGVDADPEWTSLAEEVIREGHAWVGVSAQMIGIEGGPVRVEVDIPGAESAGLGIKEVDRERYGSLDHPGDAFAYDIYTQVARALRAGQGLGGSLPSTVIAAGESQSAAAMVTYVNGVQPLTGAFDGFFVHSRGGSGLPLAEAGESVDIASSVGGAPTILRTDATVPIMVVQAENDVAGPLRSVLARQPDADLFRLWEVAGTSHADRHLVGDDIADLIECGQPMNDGPLHIVTKAALHHLVTWIDTGQAPPTAPQLELTEGDQPEVARDEDGIALGGVRTPPLEVPAQVLSGEAGSGTDVICILAGTTIPIPPDRLAELYPTREDYEQRYEAAVDTAIAGGYVLDADRDGIMAYANPDLIAG
jgi:hypothetical protein